MLQYFRRKSAVGTALLLGAMAAALYGAARHQERSQTSCVSNSVYSYSCMMPALLPTTLERQTSATNPHVGICTKETDRTGG